MGILRSRRKDGWEGRWGFANMGVFYIHMLGIPVGAGAGRYLLGDLQD